MPAYSFEAMQIDGKFRRGVIEADTVKAARSLLRAQALVPMAVSPVGSKQTGSAQSVLYAPLFGARVLSATRLAIWTRQIAGLISYGLPLERALTALTDEAEDEKQRHLMAELRAEVNSGSSFARALSQHPREFSDIYIALLHQKISPSRPPPDLHP